MTYVRIGFFLGVLGVLWLLARMERGEKAPAPATGLGRQAPRRSVVRFAQVATVLGWIFRLWGTDRSLIVDEFCTLRIIEGDFASIFERTLEFFGGPGPFHYLVTWPFIHGLGESEFVLRLPSLAAAAGAGYVVYRLGCLIEGKETGLLAMAFVWLSPVLVEASALARPYSLGTLMAAVMLFGFAKVVLEGRPRGRLLFVVGGFGLFSSHYVLGVSALGVAIGYLLFGDLRRRYPPGAFALDVLVQVLLAGVWFSHLRALWGQREQIEWAQDPQYALFVTVIGGLLVLALAPWVAGMQTDTPQAQRGFHSVLWLSIASQLGVLSLLAAAGTNLLDRRYVIVIVVPAALLAARGVRRLPKSLAVLPWCFWAALTAGPLLTSFYYLGVFNYAGYQDWRGAVAALDRRTSPDALVLYRAGLVEEDSYPRGMGSPLWIVTLESPGEPPPPWDVVPLTYRWSAEGREGYFEKRVAPKVADARDFYYIGPNFYNEYTGNYPELLKNWVHTHFPQQFEARRLDAASGVAIVHFRRRIDD